MEWTFILTWNHVCHICRLEKRNCVCQLYLSGLRMRTAEKDNQSHGMMSEGARRPLNQIKSIYIRGKPHSQSNQNKPFKELQQTVA